MNKITFKDVCQFIIDNSDDCEIMDKINKITFPFSSKYNKFVANKKEEGINYNNIEEILDKIMG